jgi:hypothetical protein
MPMFHDPDRPLDELGKKLILPEPIMIERRLSEESIRTEFCDGPILDDLNPDPPINEALESSMIASVEVSDRAELIERLKRGESPTWIPNRKVKLTLTICDILTLHLICT